MPRVDPGAVHVNIAAIVVHTTGSSAVVTGLIAGGVVLVGAIASALFTRWRDTRRQLDAATWSLFARTGRVAPGPSGLSGCRDPRLLQQLPR